MSWAKTFRELRRDRWRGAPGASDSCCPPSDTQYPWLPLPWPARCIRRREGVCGIGFKGPYICWCLSHSRPSSFVFSPSPPLIIIMSCLTLSNPHTRAQTTTPITPHSHYHAKRSWSKRGSLHPPQMVSTLTEEREHDRGIGAARRGKGGFHVWWQGVLT